MRFAAAKWEEVVAECSGVTGTKAVALRLRSMWTHLPTEDKAVRICVSICLYVLRPCPYVPLSTPLPLPLSSPLFSLSPTCQKCNLGPRPRGSLLTDAIPNVACHAPAVSRSGRSELKPAVRRRPQAQTRRTLSEPGAGVSRVT